MNRRIRVCCHLMMALAIAPASLAQSAPETQSGDAMLQMLYEKGLVPTKVTSHVGALVDRTRVLASDMVMSAINFLGVPYRRGGNDADEGFDCSGFTRHVFENSLGLLLPRRADQQAQASNLEAVQRDQLRPGDLVFFNTMRRAFSHVGIYVGDGKFIHSPRAGGQVRIEDMRQAYWAKRFNGARRADLDAAQAATH